MKKSIFTVIIALLFSAISFAQLTGVKTIPGDYPTVASAIAALNSSGIGAGGVTFNVTAGYNETFAASTDGYITTLTGSVNSPVTFIKSGAGANPVITAATGTGTMDAIIAIAGCDYVTFNGINLQENVANTTTLAQMEWGYALLKASENEGSQHITILNCNISMNITNPASIGIYSANHTITSTTPLVLWAQQGSNSYLKIYSNTINSYTGISITGFNVPVNTGDYGLYDLNNEIGKDGGNTITNVGGGSTIGYGIYTQYQDNLKVAGNTVTSTTAGTATNIFGIHLAGAYNSGYELYGNTVSIQYSGPGNSAFNPIWAEMGSLGETNTHNIYNNTVTGCTFATQTTGQIRYINIANAGVIVNVYGNTISNNVSGSSGVTATGATYSLVVNKNGPVYGPLNLYNNTITGNSRIQLTPASSTTTYIWTIGSGTQSEIHHNIITNNVVGSTGSSYGINYGVSISSARVYDNQVSDITQANGTFYGINISSFSSNVVIETFRNKIHNIQGNLAGSIIHGIYNSSSGTACYNYIYNNMISDLRVPAATQTTNASVNGIYNSGAFFLYVYHNSVFLNAASTGANFGTAAFYSVTNMSGLELKNNIFVNTSVASGTGVTAAVRFANATLTNYSQLSNNNNFFAGTPGVSNVIFFDGTNKDQTLESFQNRIYPRETQSVTEMPPFINTTTGSTNLHLQTTLATKCESGGAVVTTPTQGTVDYDLQPRFPNTGFPVGSAAPYAPDLGADEFGGIPMDMLPPVITYTALAPTNSLTPRTLTATINDGSGVPVTGAGLPVLYWKINAGAYQGVQGVPGQNGTYTFTFGSGVVTGDVVAYYIVAQDIVAIPNMTSKPLPGASGFTSSPPMCSTPPTTPESYTIVTSYTGTYHVGAGKTYENLTAAAADFNSRALTGPVTLILDDATYPTEVFPVVFNSNAGSSATNTLTIKPDTGVSVVFEAQVTTGILDLTGVDYVTINGSNNGTNSKNLTFSNPKILPNGTYAIAFKCIGNDAATNITIKNCIIKNIRLDQTAALNASIRFIPGNGSFNNCIIDNNIIHSAFTGVQVYGSAVAKAMNIQVTNNTIGSDVPSEAVSRWGVDISYADNTLVYNNEIKGPIDGSLNPAQAGVQIFSGSTNTKVRSNNIHTFWRPSDDGWGCYGVYINTDATTVTEISNNLIYDIYSAGSAPGPALSNTYGILARNGGNFKILHNTINLSGPYLSVDWDASSACIGFWQQVAGGNIEIRNNILRNGMTKIGGATTNNGRAYGIMISGDASMFSNINNNDYFIDGYNGNVGHVFTQQHFFFYPTLSDWQSYTGQESNSVTIDPLFTSLTNLLPTNPILNNKGVYIAGVPTDITGKTRNNPSDVGAYEFGNDPFINTLSSNSITSTTAVITGSANAAGTTESLYFDYGTSTAYGMTVTASPASVTGSTTTGFQASLSGLAYATKYHYRARGVSSTGMISFGVDSTFTTLAAPPSVITTSATAITSSGASLNGTVNANGATTAVTVQYGLTTAYGSTLTATPATVNGVVVISVTAPVEGLLPYTTYHFRVAASNSFGTIYGNDMTFTTLPVPASVITLAATGILGTNATLNGSVNANYAPTDVTFEYGLTTAYGTTVNAAPGQVNGNTLVAVSATLTDLALATLYHFRAVGNGPGGIVYGEDLTFLSDCPTPSIPGAINGPSAICKNTMGVVYSIDPIAGATGYIWTVPTGAIITSGENTNSITVDFPVSVINGNVTVTGSNFCGLSAISTLPVTFFNLPVPIISGPASLCLNSAGNVYSTEAGMFNYNWEVTGGTITSGAGTSSITVTWNTAGAQSVSVNYANSNGCYAPAAVVYQVTVHELPVPTITGANEACESSAYLDYVTEAGMTNYDWDMTPNSGTISLTGTNVVTIFWNTPGSKWVSVSYTDANGCTPLAATVYNVTVNPLPATPGAISGLNTVCAGTNQVVYTIPEVTNATSYNWTLPTGATIASGANSNSITVDFSTVAVSGNISVSGVNTCGTGTPSSLFVTVIEKPATPVITQNLQILTSDAPAGNQWYLNGILIAGATGQTYEVTENGTYTVIVTLNGCSSDVSNSIVIINTGVNATDVQVINIYPNPSDGSFWLSLNSTVITRFDMEILNSIGTTVYKRSNQQVTGTFIEYFELYHLSAGLYTIVLRSDTKQIIRKIVIKK